MKLHPATYTILHFTPWARLRGPGDHFYPLLALLCAVLVMDVIYILRVEAMYRETAASTPPPSLTIDRGGAFSPEPGAVVVGQRNGQPRLNW